MPKVNFPTRRRAMERAIRRLNSLEYFIIAIAMALALVAGALAAWLVERLVGGPFRVSWAVASLLFFVVPGAIVLRRERQTERVGESAENDPLHRAS
jgi:uncharacterized membrane protein